jgi:MFS transporter, NNP family, nitrate/nitrite transporter
VNFDQKRTLLMSNRDTTWISGWDPENEKFWESKGKFIARRNLIWSILAEHLGFSVWLTWSSVATKLPEAGFNYTTDQLFQLVALPGLVGSLLRFPYTFAVPRFGGRNWTIVSAALLFIPTIALAYFVARPDTPFWLMLIVAASAGVGGGNFASSMANISFFYPNRAKGWALGLNAAGGNIGVSSVQLLTPIVTGFGWLSLYWASPWALEGLYLQNAGLMWLPLIAVAAFGAYRYMDNLACADVQGSAAHREEQAHMDYVVALYRDLRLVHRLLGCVSVAAQDPVSCRGCRPRIPRTAGRVGRAPARRPAR